MAAVGHIARARAARRGDDRPAAGVRSVSRTPRPPSARRRSACRRRPTSRFRPTPCSRAITPRTRMIFLNTPNNPTGQLIPLDDLKRIAEAAPHAVVLIDEAYIEFGGDDVPAGAAALPERADRPDVLEGVRPGRHARRHRDRPAAGARPGPRRDAAVQHQRRGAGGRAWRRSRTREFLPRYAAQVARVARAAVRGLPPARPRVLGERGELRAGARRRRRAVRRRRWRARNVHVRDRSKDPTTPGCIRITAGILEHTDAAIEALESVVAARQAR